MNDDEYLMNFWLSVYINFVLFACFASSHDDYNGTRKQFFINLICYFFQQNTQTTVFIREIKNFQTRATLLMWMQLLPQMVSKIQ